MLGLQKRINRKTGQTTQERRNEPSRKLSISEYKGNRWEGNDTLRKVSGGKAGSTRGGRGRRGREGGRGWGVGGG